MKTESQRGERIGMRQVHSSFLLLFRHAKTASSATASLSTISALNLDRHMTVSRSHASLLQLRQLIPARKLYSTGLATVDTGSLDVGYHVDLEISTALSLYAYRNE